MNLKTIFTALVVALSPVAAAASTLPLPTITVKSGVNQASSTTGIFNETVGKFAFSISTEARDLTKLGYLQAEVVVFASKDTGLVGTATVEVIQEYLNFGSFSLMRLKSEAEVFDITGAEPLFPEKTSVTAQHFISFLGQPEIPLGDFPFGTSAGSQEDLNIINYQVPYKLRSLYSFGCDDDDACSARVDGTIRATPVPVPAGILLMGTALAGFGIMRRKAKRAA